MAVRTNYQFLESAAFGDLPRLESLLEQKKSREIDLDIKTNDQDGSVLQAASRKHCHDALAFQHKEMTAMHFACLIGHEEMIRHLIVNTPDLLHTRCANQETPLLTLTRGMGLVRNISDEIFETLLWSGASLDVSDRRNYNIFHYLNQSRDIAKLKATLDIFKCSKEEFSTLTCLPRDVLNIIADYGNFYSKNVLKKLLNDRSESGLGFTPWQSAAEEVKPLLAEAGASTIEFGDDLRIQTSNAFPSSSSYLSKFKSCIIS